MDELIFQGKIFRRLSQIKDFILCTILITLFTIFLVYTIYDSIFLQHGDIDISFILKILLILFLILMFISFLIFWALPYTPIRIYTSYLEMPVPRFFKSKAKIVYNFDQLASFIEIIESDGKIVDVNIITKTGKKIGSLNKIENLETIIRVIEVLKEKNIPFITQLKDECDKNPAPPWIEKKS